MSQEYSHHVSLASRPNCRPIRPRPSHVRRLVLFSAFSAISRFNCTDKHRLTDRQTDTQKQRNTHRHTDTETDKQTDRHTETDRPTQRHTETDRQRGVIPVQRVQSVCEGRLDRQRGVVPVQRVQSVCEGRRAVSVVDVHVPTGTLQCWAPSTTEILTTWVRRPTSALHITLYNCSRDNTTSPRPPNPNLYKMNPQLH